MRSLALLIGFVLMFSFPAGKLPITVFPLGGFALLLFAVLRMEKMEPVFKKAKIFLLITLPISAALLGLQIYDTVADVAVWYGAVYFAVQLLTELVEIAAMFFIYVGVKIIGTQTEITTLEKQPARNMTLMFVYFALQIIMSALYYFAPSLFSGFEFVLIYPFLVGYIWRAMNIWMAFTLLTKISVSKS